MCRTLPGPIRCGTVNAALAPALAVALGWTPDSRATQTTPMAGETALRNANDVASGEPNAIMCCVGGRDFIKRARAMHKQPVVCFFYMVGRLPNLNRNELSQLLVGRANDACESGVCDPVPAGSQDQRAMAGMCGRPAL